MYAIGLAFNRSVQHRLQSIGWRLEAQGLSRTLIEPQKQSRSDNSERCARKSVPLGRYCRSRPLVFSFEPRCQGLRGSQK